MSEDTDAPEEKEGRQLTGRTFLCVVDETEEFAAALQFACQRAKNSGGRVALLYVIQPAEFQHWMSVEEKMREEARAEAEGAQLARALAKVLANLPELRAL